VVDEMASAEHQFIFAVILMYGFIGMIYFASNGAIAGLTSTSLSFAIPPRPSGDPISSFFTSAWYVITSVWSLFAVLFLTPFISSNFWWVAPINWAIFGSTLYLFVRIIRGGG
jgi:hypothetical protein